MSGVSGEPLRMLTSWLAGDETECPPVQLATVGEDDRPDLRTVLLSEWDAEGFVFSTDSESRKVAELALNPAVALLLLWPDFRRQLVVHGTAARLDGLRMERLFEQRSAYLKQLAWQNSMEFAQLDAATRTTEWSRFGAERDPGSIAPPATWTGYLVRPDRLTFWQSGSDGPSHRVEYRLQQDGGWSTSHLAG